MDRLTFAVIGAGHFGKNYIRLLQKIPDAQLRAVTARKKESLQALRRMLPGTVIVTDEINGVLENPAIDCAVIATPPETHFEYAKKAMENGIHVLLEKPMATNLAGALRLRAVLRKNPVTFMVGHQYAYHDHINYLKKHFRGFGKISSYLGKHYYPGPVRQDATCLQDAGTHQLSIIQHLFNPGKLEKIRAVSENLPAACAGGGRAGKGGDFVFAALDFETGLHAEFALCWSSPEKIRQSFIAGQKKFALFDDVLQNDKLTIYSAGAARSPGSLSGNKTSSLARFPIPGNVGYVPKINAKEPLLNELEHFVFCIKSGATPITGMEKSMEITQWLERIGSRL